MGGKRGQILREILPVSNITQHQIIHTENGFFTRYMEPALRHNTEQSNRFHRHRLASCIRPCNHDTFPPFSELEA